MSLFIFTIFLFSAKRTYTDSIDFSTKLLKNRV